MRLSKFLSKPTLLFISLNVQREIFTMVRDIEGYRASTSSSASSATSSSPASTASTHITRRHLALRGFVPHAVPSFPAIPSFAAQETAAPTNPPSAAGRMHRMRRSPSHLVKREHISTTPTAEEESTSTTSTKRRATPTSTFSTALPTATNAASSSVAGDEEDERTCAYVGRTSVPKTTGGVVFSTLERIFCALILALSLLSELPLPPLLFLYAQKLWTSTFPPFGAEHGVGVLGVAQVFLGSNVLSKAIEGWVQVGGWLLFLVGILNLLAGLSLGRRLNPLRSLSADSTSPSALRQLRLTHRVDPRQPSIFSESPFTDPAPAPAPSSVPPHPIYEKYSHPHPDEPAPEPEMVQGPSFRPARAPSRSASRNGPNGIVIGPPRPLRPSTRPDEVEEVEDARAAGPGAGVTSPPPIYFPESRV
ncbi:hypothetical protein JCM10213_009100 [Rhodosporidiobolus nylandii]